MENLTSEQRFELRERMNNIKELLHETLNKANDMEEDLDVDVDPICALVYKALKEVDDVFIDVLEINPADMEDNSGPISAW